ncbi:MAG: ATP-dependent 6-phosphofructokinase [Actinomycetota bacterium]|nr:MAG: ATP-dependent 6-phosphofructokinase [Actinomycetota bacterium]
MRVGVLTGGGDCPGLNAVIRSVVRRGIAVHGMQIVGFADGWRGPLEGLTVPLDERRVQGIESVGGTILGSSRTNPAALPDGIERVRANLAAAGIDALVAIGGEDTLGVAAELARVGVDVVGVPKTIDNDLSGTDYTFGFDTAVNIAVEAFDRLRTTAESHHRTLVVEVMGRHAGWIALHAGLAGGATVTLIPEAPFDLDEVAAWVSACAATGRAPLVCVAEGAVPQETGLVTRDDSIDAFGHVKLSGIADRLAGQLERRTGIESRSVVLGHLQRGGPPTAFDRVLATRLGLCAIDSVAAAEFGVMAALHGTEVGTVPLTAAVGTLKTVPMDRYEEARVFFGT